MTENVQFLKQKRGLKAKCIKIQHMVNFAKLLYEKKKELQ